MAWMNTCILVLMWLTGVGFGLVIVSMLRSNHLAMNSRLDQLLKTAKILARMEGFEEGREERLEAVRQAGAVLDRQ